MLFLGATAGKGAAFCQGGDETATLKPVLNPKIYFRSNNLGKLRKSG
jgi:hypothetical protein